MPFLKSPITGKPMSHVTPEQGLDAYHCADTRGHYIPAACYRNFHDEIHLVFTAPWQKRVRDAQGQAVYEERLESALGADLVSRLQAIRSELAEHPDRNMALAYLMH